MAVNNMEAGWFFVILGIGFLFTFVSFRALGVARHGLRGLAMAMFLILAVVVGSGFQVSMTQISSQTQKNLSTGDTWIENDTNQNIIIPGGKTSNWFAWLFSGLAMLNLVLLVRSALNKDEIKR